ASGDQEGIGAVTLSREIGLTFPATRSGIRGRTGLLRRTRGPPPFSRMNQQGASYILPPYPLGPSAPSDHVSKSALLQNRLPSAITEQRSSRQLPYRRRHRLSRSARA